ncbi:MAG: hypothetical protein OCD01_17500 [Fibrobacterales bacterium]
MRLGLISLLICIICAQSIFALNGTLTGTGFEDSPYLIEDYEDLKAIAQYNKRYFRLAHDIDASASINENNGAGFEPIGSKESPINVFLNGAGHTIHHLHIYAPDKEYVGLFGYVYSSIIDSVSISGSITGNKFVGAFIGYSSGSTVRNATNKATVIGEAHTGGIVGENRGIIEHSLNLGYVSCPRYTGGITGKSGPGSGLIDIARVRFSANTGTVDGDYGVGGIAGTLPTGIIEQSYNSGTISAPLLGANGGAFSVGGIAGLTQAYTSIINCYNTGIIKGDRSIGGIVGDHSGTIENSYHAGYIFSKRDYYREGTRGITGWSSSGKVLNSFWATNKAAVDRYEETPVTIHQMLQRTTFTDWDTTVWSFDEGNRLPGLVHVNNAVFSIPTSQTITPSIPDFAIISSVALDAEGTPVTLLKKAGFSYVNTTKDSTYIHYHPGTIESNGDTLWGGVSHVAVKTEEVMAINTFDDLLKIGTEWTHPLNASYRIATDIDAAASAQLNNGLGFSPIGVLNMPFTGTVRGGGFTLSNLTINRPTEDYVGLFGYIDSGAVIDSLTINGTITGNDMVGGLAGHSYGSDISNISFSGSVTGEMTTGGIIAFVNYSKVRQVTNAATITSSNRTGGIIGACRYSLVENVQNSGLITGKITSGGIIASIDDCALMNAINTADVSGDFNTGGITGAVGVEGTVFDTPIHLTQSYNTGNISGVREIGGIAGLIQGGVLSETFNTGRVDAEQHSAGGISGNNQGVIKNSFNIGSVVSPEKIGGISGTSIGSITHCYNAGQITGDTLVGPVVGGIIDEEPLSSYWDETNAAVYFSLFGTPLSTALMYQQESYTDWDFDSVWTIQEDISYPTLQFSGESALYIPPNDTSENNTTETDPFLPNDTTIIDTNSLVVNDISDSAEPDSTNKRAPLYTNSIPSPNGVTINIVHSNALHLLKAPEGTSTIALYTIHGRLLFEGATLDQTAMVSLKLSSHQMLIIKIYKE